MRYSNSQLSLFFGLCACLVLSGCFQGYGSDVSSQAELDALLLSLTPNGNSQLVNPSDSQPTSQTLATSVPTRVPTLPPITSTDVPLLIEGGMIIHIVTDGDTLFEIAQRYSVSVEMLSALNGISDPNSLFVEQALIIPPTNVPALPTEESTQTSNLPTETATPFPTATWTPTHTPTATFTVTPSATDVIPTATTILPTATEVILSTVTPDAIEEQLNADTQIHVVETGQTLFQISRAYNIPLDALADTNNIDDPSQVTIGQQLVIPPQAISATQAEATIQFTPTATTTPIVTASPSTDTLEVLPTDAPPTDIVHVVSAGETLYQISLDYSVSLDALASENNITDTSQLLAGQELQIPDATPIAVLDSADITPQADTSSVPQRIAFDIPTQINGVPLSQIVLISPEAEANMLRIYQQGQALGRNPRAFSKLGDSTIENPHFLARFDNWQGFDYYLGEYAYLEGVIDYYSGSFIRQGAAVRRGMHSWTVFDPQWADKTMCDANESSLACEFRLQNPSLVLVRLGANDVGVPQAFENNLRDVIDFSIENGVIPILGTKADRNDGASNANNQIIRRLADEYQLPLWDFDHLADTLPRRGLTTDGVHMTINFSHDYTDPNTFRTGHGMHNLSALVMLDHLWQILTTETQ